MKVGFGGLTENIVYVRRLSDDPRRVPAERFGRCQWRGGGVGGEATQKEPSQKV